MPQNWIKSYKGMSYNVIDQKRGRSSTVLKKINKPKSKETIEEKNKRLKK